MIDKILKKAIELNASDIHITVGRPPLVRINGELIELGKEIVNADLSEKLALELLSNPQLRELDIEGEIDFAITIANVGRLRANIYKQKDNFTIALRIIGQKIPKLEDLNLPDVLKELSLKRSGLVLVTGPTGSGKSTTLAAMIDYINRNRNCHILTLEDPVEFIHEHKNGIINQREIGRDTKAYNKGLKAALRQDPDVILIGEMRDIDTIATAITAAETGHLVLSTLHTTGAVNGVNRIIDVFPGNQQQQIKLQLSSVLGAIISQNLIKRSDNQGRELALEILVNNGAVSNLIREGKTQQILTVIQTGLKQGMITMEKSVEILVNEGKISKEIAKEYLINSY